MVATTSAWLVLALWELAERYSPAGLTGLIPASLRARRAFAVHAKIGAGLACVAAGVTLAVAVLRRREL